MSESGGEAIPYRKGGKKEAAPIEVDDEEDGEEDECAKPDNGDSASLHANVGTDTSSRRSCRMTGTRRPAPSYTK